MRGIRIFLLWQYVRFEKSVEVLEGLGVKDEREENEK